jgi:hypothetical protein
VASKRLLTALITAGAMLTAAGITAAATLAARPDPDPPSQSIQTSPPQEGSVESTSPEPVPSAGDVDGDGDDGGGGSDNLPSTAAETWVADVEPIVDTGLWYSGPAEIRNTTYVHSMQTSQTGVKGQTVWAQYALDGEYDRLTGLLGILDGGHASEKAVFEIVVDGTVVKQVQVAIGEQPVAVDVPLAGAQDLVLRVTNVSQSAYWANPVFADFRLT